jgi:hypothetical protein
MISPKPDSSTEETHALQVTAPEERSVAQNHAQVPERLDQEADGKLQEECSIAREAIQGDDQQVG